MLLLFDIDGTLLNTHGAGVACMARVAKRLFGGDFGFANVNFAGHLDPLIFHEAAEEAGLADPWAALPRFRDAYLKALAGAFDGGEFACDACPGIHALIDALATDPRVASGQVVLGCLTGNFTDAVPIKLRAAGLDPEVYRIRAFGDHAACRADLVQLAIARDAAARGHRLDPEQVIIIGDTPRDIACAHASGAVAFCVGTGRMSAAELRQAGADHAVADLADPAPLLDLLPG